MTESRQKGVRKRAVGAGVQKTFLGEGFYGMSPPLLSFHPPLPLSDYFPSNFVGPIYLQLFSCNSF